MMEFMARRKKREGGENAEWSHETSTELRPRASSAKTRGFHTQLDEGPETP